MTDTNNIFLYNIPKFKHSKVYPVDTCDLCCDISVVEYCPLTNCEYKMCGLCWYKMINNTNRCPACRREFPDHRTCKDKLETCCIDNIESIKYFLFFTVLFYMTVSIMFLIIYLK